MVTSSSPGMMTSFAGIFGGFSSSPATGSHGSTATHSPNAFGRRRRVDSAFLDTDCQWPMDADVDTVSTTSSEAAANKGRTRHSQGLSQQGSFNGLFGMSPCLGAPPVDSAFWTSGMATATAVSFREEESSKRRKRHFSLEDFHDDFFADGQSSSESSNNESYFAAVYGNNNLDITDLNPVKSFINDTPSFLEDSLSSCCELGLVSAAVRDDLESKLLGVVHDSKEIDFHVTFPAGLLQVIATHVIQEAESEPYGLKGCIVHIQYEGQTALYHVGSLVCDPDTVPTFEVTITLRQGQTTWSQRMARRLSFTTSQSLPASTSYKLVKKRRYCDQEPKVVVDVNAQ